MIKVYLTLYTTTSCTEFKKFFVNLQKQHQYLTLQVFLLDEFVLISVPQPINNLACVRYILDYSIDLYIDYKEDGTWEVALNKILGAFGMLAKGIITTHSYTLKCFNCDGPCHLQKLEIQFVPISLKWRTPEAEQNKLIIERGGHDIGAANFNSDPPFTWPAQTQIYTPTQPTQPTGEISTPPTVPGLSPTDVK